MIALVTGATSGSGREIARQLLALGHTAYVDARDAARGEAPIGAAADTVERLDFLPHLRASTHPRIVNLSSGAGAAGDEPHRHAALGDRRTTCRDERGRPGRGSGRSCPPRDAARRRADGALFSWDGTTVPW